MAVKRKRKVKENDLVLVDWDDSCGSGRWEDRESAYNSAANPEGIPCRTVGWVLRSSPKALTLNASRSKYSVNDQTSIPWSAVRRIELLTPNSTPKGRKLNG
jgi:hypothetical protein